MIFYFCIKYNNKDIRKYQITKILKSANNKKEENTKPFDGCRYGHHLPNNIVVSLVVLMDFFL